MCIRALGTILLTATLTAASGCGTCVRVEATYDEIWEATRDALLVQPYMTSSDPVQRYDAGTIDAVVRRPDHRDELTYHVAITPVGGETPVKRKVCVQVRELDAVVVDGLVGDRTERVQAVQRRDLEQAVTALIELVFQSDEGTAPDS